MTRRTSKGGFLRTRGPALAFGTFTLTGCVFIWTAKALGLPALFVTGLPVLLMVAYLVASIVLGALRVQDEQIGDNLYYMGFLFTLTSLGASLYQFNAADSIDTIVRNFGVAVASTIFGIALRILYNQMRRDPMDVEKATRHELAEMTRRIRTELDAATKEFATFRRVSNQMLQEGFDEIARQAESSGKQIAGALETLTHQALGPIRDAAERVNAVLETAASGLDATIAGSAEKLSSASTRIENANMELASSVSRFGNQVDAVGDRLSSLKPADEVLRHELAPLITALGSAVADHAKALETVIEGQKVRTDPSSAAAAVLAGIQKGLQASAAANEASAKSAEQAFAAATKLHEAIVSQQADIRELTQTLSVEREYSLTERIAEDLTERLGSELAGLVQSLDNPALQVGTGSDDVGRHVPIVEIPRPDADTSGSRGPWG